MQTHHILTHSHTQTHTITPTSKHPHADMQIHAHTPHTPYTLKVYTYARTSYKHASTHIFSYMRTCTRTQICMYTYVNICLYNIYTNILTREYTHTLYPCPYNHSNTKVINTHVYTETHKHMHVFKRIQRCIDAKSYNLTSLNTYACTN